MRFKYVILFIMTLNILLFNNLISHNFNKIEMNKVMFQLVNKNITVHYDNIFVNIVN